MQPNNQRRNGTHSRPRTDVYAQKRSWHIHGLVLLLLAASALACAALQLQLQAAFIERLVGQRGANSTSNKTSWPHVNSWWQHQPLLGQGTHTRPRGQQPDNSLASKKEAARLQIAGGAGAAQLALLAEPPAPGKAAPAQLPVAAVAGHTNPTQQLQLLRGTGVSAAEVLQLISAYSRTLSALSAALDQARLRAEEAAALKQQLDTLRQRQQQLLHPYLQPHLQLPDVAAGHGKQQAQVQVRMQRPHQLAATATTAAAGGRDAQQVAQLLELGGMSQQQQVLTSHRHINVTALPATAAGGAAAADAAAGGAADAATGAVLLARDADRAGSFAKHEKRHEKHIRMFIGVYTGFNNASQHVEQRYNYSMRRAALRATWFAGDAEERQRFEAQHGVVLRFIVGSAADPVQEAQLRREREQHGDILRLPLQEHYSQLPNKTRLFFKWVTDTWEPDWVLKLDDDVYLNPLRLMAASRQWDRMGAQYVGCMKHGVPWKAPGSRWFEPAHLLVGGTYWLHAYGSIYAIAGPVARSVIAANWAHLRLLANEDTSVGLWMLAANTTYFEDMRLCSPTCTPASVGILRNECAGLCDPLKELPQLHNSSTCSGPPTTPLRYHASYPEHTAFEQMWVP